MKLIFKNLGRSLVVPPCSQWRVWGPWFCLYAVTALGIGLSCGLVTPGFLDLRRFWYLPVSLLVFPCILEECVFRGLLIQRDVLTSGSKRAAAQIALSSLAFTLWHPLNALTISPTWRTGGVRGAESPDFSGFERDLQAVGQEGEENVRLDAFLKLMIDGADGGVRRA